MLTSIAYRHGLRASELVNLRVSHLDLAPGTIYCRRISNIPLFSNRWRL
jgi:integrase